MRFVLSPTSKAHYVCFFNIFPKLQVIVEPVPIGHGRVVKLSVRVRLIGSLQILLDAISCEITEKIKPPVRRQKLSADRKV